MSQLLDARITLLLGVTISSTILQITVAISMSASYVSAITILGAPADVYLYGNSYAMHPLAVLIVDVIAIVYYIPIFYELKLLSVFEVSDLTFKAGFLWVFQVLFLQYLEMRFHKSLRMIASGLQITCLVCRKIDR